MRSITYWFVNKFVAVRAGCHSREAARQVGLLALVGLWACDPVPEEGSQNPTTPAVSYESPEALIEEMNRLRSGDCDYPCQWQIASMHSADFLARQRQAITVVMTDETRSEMTLALFGARIPAAAVAAMTDQEFFARQLLHVERSAPADMTLRTVTVVSEAPSERGRRLLVTRSGLAADPAYQEEDVVDFVREAGGWKISN